ncbi:MAG: hypothetical protein FJ100_15780 [Deltaproteobacteria bacterium]|nr:hypothetical protein [Deltaproteobacteria bacterium]
MKTQALLISLAVLVPACAEPASVAGSHAGGATGLDAVDAQAAASDTSPGAADAAASADTRPEDVRSDGPAADHGGPPDAVGILCDPKTGSPPPGQADACKKGTALCGGAGTVTAVYTCNSVGCWNTAPCPADGPCVQAGPAGVGCTSGFGSCQGVYDAFFYLVGHHAPCAADSDCHLLKARCTVGLGVHGVAVNKGFSQAQLDGLAKTASKLGCKQYTCAATPPPIGAKCGKAGCEAF